MSSAFGISVTTRSKISRQRRRRGLSAARSRGAGASGAGPPYGERTTGTLPRPRRADTLRRGAGAAGLSASAGLELDGAAPFGAQRESKYSIAAITELNS